MRLSTIRNIYGNNALYSDKYSTIDILTARTAQIPGSSILKLNVNAACTLAKHSTLWDSSTDGMQYSILLIDISPTGSVIAGEGVTLVDALEVGANMCVARCINNGTLSIFRIPE